MTLEEHVGELFGLKLVFVGDGRNNMANSLMLGAAQMGLDFRIAAPASLHPDPELVAMARRFAEMSGATITITDNIAEAVHGAEAIYTDVWVSMGEEEHYAERIELLRGFQVNADMLRMSGNDNVKFLHCLPAFHDLKTATAEKIKEQYGLTEMEVTDEVFRSPASIVFDQAENRMHTIKAVVALTI
jgi:ornithine carbamoyltransferase